MGVADVAKRSRAVVIAYYLQKDARAHWTRRNGVRTGGHAGADLDVYAQQVFRGILRHLSMTPDDLRGLRVLEIGPGDNLGAARLMHDHGAEVVALDQFASNADNAITFARIAIEDTAEHFGEDRFDLIYSVAVLEHVADLDAAFEAMYRLLAPGGVMGHQIGGGDHGMFTDGGHHPLTYMTIPAPLWRAMTAHSGGPNRILPSRLREIVSRYDWDWDLAVTDTADIDVEAIRPHLREPFRRLSTDELRVMGTFLTARAAQ